MSEAAEQPSPRERALEAMAEFEEACEEVEDESPAVRLKQEADAFEEFTDTLGECFADGLKSMSAGQFADTVAELSSSLNKTEAKQQIASKSMALKAEETGRKPLDDWIGEKLDQVRVVRTTDHVDDTRYVWDFGDVTVETSSGEEGRGHYNYVNFRDSIHEAGGPYLLDPNDPLKDSMEWRAWIVDQLEENEQVKTTKGMRTNAVEYLQNRVRRSDAHGSLGDALNYNGVYAELSNDPPDGEDSIDTDRTPQPCPDWRVDTLYIDNEWPKEAAEEFGISTRALQNEIDARGYMLEGHSKIATQEYVDGQYVTFWVLDGDFATPAAFQPEGEATDVSGVGALEADEEQRDDRDDFGSIGGN